MVTIPEKQVKRFPVVSILMCIKKELKLGRSMTGQYIVRAIYLPGENN